MLHGALTMEVGEKIGYQMLDSTQMMLVIPVVQSTGMPQFQTSQRETLSIGVIKPNINEMGMEP